MTVLKEQRAVLDKGDFGSPSMVLMIGEEMYQALVEIHVLARRGSTEARDLLSKDTLDRIAGIIERMSEQGV